MARHRVSIRVRLAIGLGLVLAVFSAALLLTLHYLAELKQMSGEVTVRMEVRRQVLATVRAAQLLQSGFPATTAPDPANLARFDNVYNRLQEGISFLLTQRADQPENTYLVELRQASTDLRSILQHLTAAVAAKAPPATIEDLTRQSREMLTRIEQLNNNLVDIFDMHVMGAAEKAQGA